MYGGAEDSVVRQKVEYLPWEGMKEKIDHLFWTTEETPAPKAPMLLAQHETSVPLLKVAEAILKTQKPDWGVQASRGTRALQRQWIT